MHGRDMLINKPYLPSRLIHSCVSHEFGPKEKDITRARRARVISYSSGPNECDTQLCINLRGGWWRLSHIVLDYM